MKQPSFALLPKVPWRSPYLTAVASVLVVVLGIAAYVFWYVDKYLPHTVVAGIEVSGLTKAEAESKVLSKIAQFNEQKLILTFEDRTWEVAPSAMGSSFAANIALAEVWEAQKGGGAGEQVKRLALAPFKGRHEDIGFTTFSTEGRATFAADVLKNIELPHNETTLAISSREVTVVQGKPGKKLNDAQFEEDFYQAFVKNSSKITLALVAFEPELTPSQAETAKLQAQQLLADTWYVRFGDVGNGVIEPARLATWFTTAVGRDGAGNPTELKLTLKKDLVEAAVADWATNFNRDASNGRVGVADGKVVLLEEGKNGLAVDQPATTAALEKALMVATAPEKRDVTGVVVVAKPEVRADTLASLGITQLIGTGSTDFTGSPSNRRTNITLGQKNLNGKLVKPGGVYSTVDELGPIEESTGFAIGLVIKNNRTIPEAGGGICQVSTTLFRAIMNAGLPITERANHSYRVSYYERGVGPGLDATIYGPHPDFRWKNDFPNSVLVQSFIKGSVLTFEIYGTSDGRVSKIDNPTLLETIPVGAPIYIPTDTLFVGEEQKIESAHDGAKTIATYIVTRDGKEINRQIFRSTYKAWPAQYLTGTKER
ncbi:VanW family protein [soil metagenome]